MQSNLINNLVNIKKKDKIFRIYSSLLLDTMDLYEFQGIIDYLKIIAGDVFSACYTIYPILIERNPDNILESARNVLKKIIKNDTIRFMTMLNLENSLIFSSIFLRKILEELQKNKKQNSTPYDDGVLLNRILTDEKLMSSIIQESHETTEAISKLFSDNSIFGNVGKSKGLLKFLKKNTKLIKLPKLISNIYDVYNSIMKNVYTNYSPSRSIFHTGEIKDTSNSNIFQADYLDIMLSSSIDELFLYKLANSMFKKTLYTAPSDTLQILLIDKSGSMTGTYIEWAAAVALAFSVRFRELGIPHVVFFFDSVTYNPIEDPEEIIENLSNIVEANGGTDITRVINMAIEYKKSRRKYDRAVINLISDGEDEAKVNYKDLINNKIYLNFFCIGCDRAYKSVIDLVSNVKGKIVKVEPTPDGGAKILTN